ncbi:MAG: glycosyltransferase family 2 protein [Planctomycetes bacterium]|nr:glycosyltransferase family 2 protein [Planctomycetota bacterium]
MNDSPVSVLIPAYNEEATIGSVIEQVLRLGSLVREVVVVDDGSSDGTASIVRRVAEREPKVRYVRLDRNRGKTAAIRRAIQEAVGAVVIIQDADLEYDPAEIPEVVRPILEGRADVVYGSRFLVRREARVLYYYHYLANRFLTLLSNLLTNRNMSDIETCYKAFRSCVVKPLELTSRRFGLEVEFTAMVCQTRVRTYEVPISYHGRTYEEGKKIGMRDGLAALWYIFRYNVIRPRTRAGRRYIREVNAALKGSPSGVLGDPSRPFRPIPLHPQPAPQPDSKRNDDDGSSRPNVDDQT